MRTTTVSVIHNRPMYIICPDMLSTVGETSQGIRVGFTESDKVLTIFLFIYLYLRCKVCFCPVNQIKIIFLIEKNSHFTPELATCALEDLTVHNLAYTACLLECLRQYENSFSSFILVLGGRFACVRLLPFVC